MARVQLVIPDEDRDRFADQARREGVSFSEWLREAARERFDARERLERKRQTRGFKTKEDLEAFWRKCDEHNARHGIEREPDWEEHLATINASKSSGLPNT